MASTVEKVSSNQVKISFEVPAAEFDAAVQKAYLKMRGRVQVPGFRRGHAPRKVIEKMYGEGVFYETKVGDIDNNRHIQNPNVITKVQKKSGRETFRSLKNTNRSLINVFGNRLARNRSFPGIFPDELDEDLTTFGIEKGRITSCMLFSKEADGIVRNRFLYREKTNRRDGMSLLKLLTRVSTVALEKLSPSTRLSFFTGNGNTKAIVLKIFPDAVPMQEYIVYELPFSELRSNAE